jgi:tetratricopeptide (TPR) repeat protein
MRKALIITPLMGAMLALVPQLSAQSVCPGYSIVINTPEDELTLAYNGAESPQEQLQALDKFMQEHAGSKFIPCAHEYYTMTYLKLNEYDKVIEHGEAALALNHRDVMTSLNLAKAYVASGKVTDAAFDALLGAAGAINAESTPSRPSNISEEEWKKETDAAAQQAADWRAYMEYAFFQLIQREPDGNKRMQWLGKFSEAYPESPNAAQLVFNYYLAAKLANDQVKADEYGEKAIAADPNNVTVLNLVADDHATRTPPGNLDKAEGYAKKVLELAPAAAKPEGVPEDQFKASQDSQLGMAHLTLGYIAYLRGEKTKRYAPAIQEFKTASDLLGTNPALQGRALFYLGYAYEASSPPNHKGAIEALSRAAALQSPWQAAAADILAKVKKAVGQ